MGNLAQIELNLEVGGKKLGGGDFGINGYLIVVNKNSLALTQNFSFWYLIILSNVRKLILLLQKFIKDNNGIVKF